MLCNYFVSFIKIFFILWHSIKLWMYCVLCICVNLLMTYLILQSMKFVL